MTFHYASAGSATRLPARPVGKHAEIITLATLSYCGQCPNLPQLPAIRRAHSFDVRNVVGMRGDRPRMWRCVSHARRQRSCHANKKLTSAICMHPHSESNSSFVAGDKADKALYT
jgi:hypothetical protein